MGVCEGCEERDRRITELEMGIRAVGGVIRSLSVPNLAIDGPEDAAPSGSEGGVGGDGVLD